jgi:hypothetical protein
MSYIEELEEDMIALRKNTEIDIDELMRLSAIQARARMFEGLRNLIQLKDSQNDTVAAEVLSWAWQELSN